MQVMCVRGILMLMLNDQFADYIGQHICEKILEMFVELMDDTYSDEKREIEDLDAHVPAFQFICVMPTQLLHEFVMQLQNVLTLNIIQGVQINYQLFTETIKVLDLFQWVNSTFKDSADRI